MATLPQSNIESEAMAREKLWFSFRTLHIYISYFLVKLLNKYQVNLKLHIKSFLYGFYFLSNNSFILFFAQSITTNWNVGYIVIKADISGNDLAYFPFKKRHTASVYKLIFLIFQMLPIKLI